MNIGTSHRGTETQRKSEVKEILTVATAPLTAHMVGSAIEVHGGIGPGLLESIFESEMAIELEFTRIKFQRQAPVPTKYRERLIDDHRLDFIVESAVVVEPKGVERFDPIFDLTYFKPTNFRMGHLINFNSCLVRDGIGRFAL
jgi:GxxExxY protein